MRIADLKPDFGTAPKHPNRPREALDASPHPNGSGPLGPLGLSTKWDGLGGAAREKIPLLHQKLPSHFLIALTCCFEGVLEAIFATM